METDTKIQDLSDHNYVIATGMLISNSAVGEFINSYKMSIFNSGVPDSQFNNVFVKEQTTKPEKYIQLWEQYFVPKKFTFRASFAPGLDENFESILLEKGYKADRATPVMILSHLPEETPRQDTLQIKQVIDAEGLSHFGSVAEESYSLPAGAGPFVVTEKIMNMPDTAMFVGYCEGQPACISMLVKTGPVAGIYWVGTLEKFRNRGFGKFITLQAVVSGKHRGCEFACLQASEMGRPVYENIGFDLPYFYKTFASPDPQAV